MGNADTPKSDYAQKISRTINQLIAKYGVNVLTFKKRVEGIKKEVEKSSPGNFSGEPYTSSADEQPKSYFIAERRPSKTSGVGDITEMSAPESMRNNVADSLSDINRRLISTTRLSEELV
ncbi:hypothetical protein TNCT_323381 [Trichonephila clavata]|uniref:Uncharacterized protein n=1 Tax=Trichonephila clavata TaxID=2740835 RepID=A0A8X6HHZ0_TRICU|nr:hypothetical protein TNCT_323381 [Trichonephila clavata]